MYAHLFPVSTKNSTRVALINLFPISLCPINVTATHTIVTPFYYKNIAITKLRLKPGLRSYYTLYASQ